MMTLSPNTTERNCQPLTISRRAVLAGVAASSAAIAGPAISKASETAAMPQDPILNLPFVRNSTNAERMAGMPPRIFWSVQPSGDYSRDCDTGHEYARLALEYMVREDFNNIMQWAVFDMMRAGPEHSGIEVGFLSVFAKHARATHRLMGYTQKGEKA